MLNPPHSKLCIPITNVVSFPGLVITQMHAKCASRDKTFFFWCTVNMVVVLCEICVRKRKMNPLLQIHPMWDILSPSNNKQSWKNDCKLLKIFPAPSILAAGHLFNSSVNQSLLQVSFPGMTGSRGDNGSLLTDTRMSHVDLTITASDSKMCHLHKQLHQWWHSNRGF